VIESVSYLRVSGRGQIDGDGFPRQRERIGKFSKSNKFQIAQEFVEEGISGTNELDERPALGELFDRIASNGVRVVLVENASRLARDLMVQEIILDQFRKLGVKVIEAEGGNDLTVADGNPTAVLIRQILGAVSQFEKSVLVNKLRSARIRKRRHEGKCEGRKAYGHSEEERLIVLRVKGLRRKPRGGAAMSYQSIADELNRQGIPTRGTEKGGPGKWQSSTVRNICRRA